MEGNEQRAVVIPARRQALDPPNSLMRGAKNLSRAAATSRRGRFQEATDKRELP